jgi:chromosome segregation ATPase
MDRRECDACSTGVTAEEIRTLRAQLALKDAEIGAWKQEVEDYKATLVELESQRDAARAECERLRKKADKVDVAMRKVVSDALAEYRRRGPIPPPLPDNAPGTWALDSIIRQLGKAYDAQWIRATRLADALREARAYVARAMMAEGPDLQLLAFIERLDAALADGGSDHE